MYASTKRWISAALISALMISGCATTEQQEQQSGKQEPPRSLHIGDNVYEIPPHLEIRVRLHSDPSQLVTVDDQSITVESSDEIELVRADGTRVPLDTIHSIELKEKESHKSDNDAGEIVATILMVPLAIAYIIVAILAGGALSFE